MVNELLFIGAVLVDLFFVLGSIRFGRAGLILAITLNLVLVATFGPKLIEVFGILTNVGVVFYGSLFLASNMLVERYGASATRQAVWIAFAGNFFFVLMGQFALRFLADPQTGAVSDAIVTLFSTTPRLALASILAYLIAQYCNVWLYTHLKRTQPGAELWFRHIASLTLAQGIDSIIFFTVAFSGLLHGSTLLIALVVGFLIKVAIGIVSTPLLYLSTRIPVEEIDDHVLAR